jgi:type I restriction enzyme M protein
MLRGPFKPKEYGKVILPFTVLARLDAVLAPTKRAVLEILPSVENRPELVRDRELRQAAGASFYNTSRYSLRSLGDPAQLAGNLKDLVDGFDSATREIFDKFEMHKVIDNLDTYDRLAMITKEFAFKLDVHPSKVSNAEMGTLFEELIRRFMESSKETAGEHFTPREVIRLMVGLLFSADDENLAGQTPMRQVYDPTCGTGGMLSVAEDWIAEHAPHVKLTLAGQEQNAETYAIAKADMLIKGHNVDNLVHGDTLTKPGHTGQTFSYCLANPPFGVDWKVQREAVEKERDRDGDAGRFAAGLPPVNDGSMLFLQHLVSKMHPVTQGGGRAAIVLNGSPLFTGGAGSGPSEIRRHLIEHDLVEAIIGLPTDMFYNTGIATYIWVLTNRKTAERQGKIQLIDATGMWIKMRKSLGSKRRELSLADIDRIISLHGQFTDADPEHSRVLDNTEFGYRTLTVERPLRQVFTITDDLIEEAMVNRVVGKLDSDAQHQLRHALESQDGGHWTRENDFRIAIRKTGIAVTEPLLKALVAVFGASDAEGDLVTDPKHRPVADPSLRDTENVPLDQDIHDYLEREVHPWVPDAWIDETKTRVGYEIPFTRVFYRYVPPRPLAEIDKDVQEAIARIEALFAEVKK